MVNPDTIRSILGIIGNVTSFFLFLSPAPTIWSIWTNKSVQEFKYHTIVAGIMNCVMWIFYAMPFVHPDSVLVTTINSVGLSMYIAFNIIYFVYADNGTRKSMGLFYLAEAIFLVALGCITMLIFHSQTARATFVGVFCDIFGVLLYASPLTVMVQVIRTKSVEYMPPTLSLAGFLNGVVWSAYAIIRFDPYILIGNGAGALLGLSQLILYGCYCGSTPVRVEAENDELRPDTFPLSSGPHAV